MNTLRKFSLALGDIIVFYLSFNITLFLGFGNQLKAEIYRSHLFPFLILYLGWFLLLYIFNLYDLDAIKPKLKFLSRTLGALLACGIIGIIFFYLFPIFGITPKTNLVINLISFGILFIIWRQLFYNLFSSHFIQRLAVVGRNNLSEKLISEIKENPQHGYQIVGFINLKKNILKQIKEKKIDVLVVAKDFYNQPHFVQELYKSLSYGVRLWNLGETYETIFKKIPIDFINKTWLLENLKSQSDLLYSFVKRFFSIIGSLFVIILTSPVWLIIALAIKIEDRGPIFYKQKRVGLNEKDFYLYKFRSMKEEAEKDGPQWAQKKDNRITRVGRITRRLHLDELPQMINVLKGDISMVGPRPERPTFVKQLKKEIPHYSLRHIVKSGFTGWAQIKYHYARSLKDSHEKFQYDLYYIKNRNLLLDFGILLKTIQIIFKKS